MLHQETKRAAVLLVKGQRGTTEIRNTLEGWLCSVLQFFILTNVRYLKGSCEHKRGKRPSASKYLLKGNELKKLSIWRLWQIY